MLKYLNGLLLSGSISFVSILICKIPIIEYLKFSSLIIAIILGMIWGNLFLKFNNNCFQAGITLSQKKILRLGIILYGFKVTFQQVYSIGLTGIITDIIVITTIMLLGYFFGTKVLKLEKTLAVLISSGSAVCGAAAVLSVENTLKARPYEVAIAIATVVIFGTIAMFTFPYIIISLHYSNYYAGLAIGSCVHEVAQVIAAGNIINQEVLSSSVIVKLTRVMLLLPLIVILNYIFIYFKLHTTNEQTASTKTSFIKIFPWFAVGFILVSGINSLNFLSSSIVSNILNIDNFLLTMAMAALGVETKFNKLTQVGIKPFLLGLFLFFILLFILLLIGFIGK